MQGAVLVGSNHLISKSSVDWCVKKGGNGPDERSFLLGIGLAPTTSEVSDRWCWTRGAQGGGWEKGRGGAAAMHQPDDPSVSRQADGSVMGGGEGPLVWRGAGGKGNH